AIERNDLARAANACREEAARHPDREPLLTERLLAILCARDGTLGDAAELAEAARVRWPDLVMPSLALAAVATFRGGGQVAAAHFADAAQRARARGDALLAARAAVAAATQWRTIDPAQALPLYQLALSLRPDDRESADALAELYATAGRWLELRAHIHARLPSLRDPAAARVDLEAAATLAPDDRRVWERLAQLCEAAGDAPASIAALERLVAILATTDDRLAEARALVRMASRYEDLGDDQAALTHYRRALALGPEDPGAQERFAGVAARQGDVTTALDAYRQLYERGGGTSDRRRRAAQRLLQLLVATGDVHGARQLLPALIDEPAPDVLIGLARLEDANDELSEAAELWGRAAAQLQGAEAATAELERGRLCRLTAAFDDERQALARAFAVAPELPEVVAALARLVVLSRVAGDGAAEAEWIDRLLAAAPALTDPELVTMALRRARLFVAAADATSAARLLGRLVAAGHDGPAVQRLDADVRGLAGDFAGRAAALETLARNAGDDAVSLWILAASSRLDAGDLAAADADCVAAAARAPDDAGVRAFAAELAWQRQDWDAVAALYGALAESTTGETR
ncbi:MAG TPA: tetratricopeptide repeat protein, partial [Polyangia bacterium]|nr:tetratricopeptide repeat protein [Polyangia bacterium]